MTEMTYYIIQKSGYTYNFIKFRKLSVEGAILKLEVQYKPRCHYKRIELYLNTIKHTNIF